MTPRLGILLALLAALAAPASAVADGSAVMTKAKYGKAWPLTVASGVVHCNGYSVTFTAGGVTYAVNGTALNRHPSLPRIIKIWRKNPAIPGARINIGPIIDRGLKLCGG